MALGIEGPLGDTLRTVHEAGLDVVPDGAAGEFSQRSDIVEGEGGGGVHDIDNRQYYCSYQWVPMSPRDSMTRRTWDL